MTWPPRWAFSPLLFLGIALGCGGAKTTPVELSNARMARAAQQQAPARAPELWARFEQVRREAEQQPPTSPVRADYQTEARLWLEAAISEADRIELSEARLGVEREIAQLEAEQLELEQARQVLARQSELAAAASIARQEASLAVSRAALKPAQRAKLAPSAVEQAVAALIARASLVQSALGAFGVNSESLATLQAKLDQARAAQNKSPDQALRLADEALFQGLALLGPLRAAQATPSQAERGALAEALDTAGLGVQRNDRGLAGRLPDSFAGSELKPGAQLVLGRICALARAHPHGPVRFAAPGTPRAQADARAETLRRELAREGCRGERFGVDVVVAAEPELDVTWLAY